jgi:lysophospholipase L1-like esterase
MKDNMKVIKHRSGLLRTIKAIKAGKLTIGFIGGSITAGGGSNNWPEPVCAWFQKTYPNLKIHIVNAAIGATGSDLAVFRAERDLIQFGCDIVFIEFAVNDEGVDTERRTRTREGLVRTLLKDEARDIVFTYTYSHGMYKEMIDKKVPSSISELEQIAIHYDIGSVWMGLHAFLEVQMGGMRWEEWLPDGLHPQHRGSFSYGQSVTQFLQTELIDNPSSTALGFGKLMRKPFNKKCWDIIETIPLTSVKTSGAWFLQQWVKSVWIDQALHTSSPGAKLSFEFAGRGLLLGFDFGKTSAEFKYKVDNSKWLFSNRDHPAWCGNEGWYRPFIVSDDLKNGKHTFELEVIHGNPLNDSALATSFTGTNFNLALIGVIK